MLALTSLAGGASVTLNFDIVGDEAGEMVGGDRTVYPVHDAVEQIIVLIGVARADASADLHALLVDLHPRTLRRLHDVAELLGRHSIDSTWRAGGGQPRRLTADEANYVTIALQPRPIGRTSDIQTVTGWLYRADAKAHRFVLEASEGAEPITGAYPEEMEELVRPAFDLNVTVRLRRIVNEFDWADQTIEWELLEILEARPKLPPAPTD